MKSLCGQTYQSYSKEEKNEWEDSLTLEAWMFEKIKLHLLKRQNIRK